MRTFSDHCRTRRDQPVSDLMLTGDRAPNARLAFFRVMGLLLRLRPCHVAGRREAFDDAIVTSALHPKTGSFHVMAG